MAHTAPQDALKTLETAFEKADIPGIRTLLPPLENAHPTDVRLKVARARLRAVDGDVGAAITLLEKHVADPKDGALARAYLGALLVAQRRHADGRVHLEAALAAGADVPAGRHALGVALLALGHARDSVAHLAKAAERMPSSAPTHFYLGVAMAELAQWEHAATALGAAIRLQPSYEEAYDAASRVELARGNADRAKAILQEGLAAAKDSPILLRAQAQVCSQLGDARGALSALQKLPAKDLSAEDRTNLALMSMGVGDGGSALRHAEAAVKADALSHRAQYALGLALEAQKPLPRPKMLAAYRKAVELGDPLGDAGTRLGFVLMEEDTPAAATEAVKVLEAAVTRSGQAPGSVLNLALAYARSKDAAKAKAMCNTILADARASASDREQAQRLLKTLG